MREPQRRIGLPRFGQPRRRGRARRDPLPPSLRPSVRPGPARPDLVALERWPRARGGSAIPWATVASLLAHLAVVALLLWQGQGGRMEEPQPSPPAVDVVFESGQPEPRATGAREGEDPSAEEPPSRAEAPPPAPEAPPMQVAPPAPPPVAAPLPPLPAPPTTTTPVAALPQPPAPPVVAPLRPPEPAAADLPQRPVEPAPRLSAEVPPITPLPGLLAPQTPLELAQPRVEPLPSPSPTPPAPSPAPPAVVPRPAPRPQQQQQAQPAPRLPGLYLPEGPSFSAPRPRPGRLEGQRPQLDLAVSPRLLEGRTSPDPSVQVRGAQVGPNWNAAFRRWLDQNLHYPIRAIEEGDSGTVRVQVTARPDGTVTGVRLTGASTSPWLNSGTTRPFPGARLPPFPPGADPSVEVDLTVHYVLIRR